MANPPTLPQLPACDPQHRRPPAGPLSPGVPRGRPLTPADRRLLDLLDRVWFGRVEDLAVRGGEPAFEPPPRVTRTLKLNGQVVPRPPACPGRRQPTPEQAALLGHLRDLGDGLVRRIEVARGLPQVVEVYDPPPLAA